MSKSPEEFFKKEADCIDMGDMDGAIAIAKEAMAAGISPFDFLVKGICPGLDSVGTKFNAKEYFYPDLVCAADVTMAAMKIVKPYMRAGGGAQQEEAGVYILGSVEGDLHDIGTDLVKTVLEASGWKVIDVGIDCPADKFIKAAKENNADIVGSSLGLGGALKFQQKEIEDKLKEAGIRGKLKTMIGGSFATQQWADEIGADAYGKDCFIALTKANELMRKLKEERKK
jgi:methanogenic corrinoid protein MtbC1